MNRLELLELGFSENLWFLIVKNFGLQDLVKSVEDLGFVFICMCLNLCFVINLGKIWFAGVFTPMQVEFALMQVELQ